MEELTNQSEVVIEGQQVDQQVEQTPDTTQEQYFEVKYNKEPVKVSYDEAPDYIQKGMNYDKVQGRLTEYEQNLEKIAKLSGYNTHDELLQAVAEAEKQQERAQYEQAGIDPDTFNSLLEKHPDIQYAREMKQKQEEEAKFQEQANELFQEFPNLKPDDIQPEVWQLQANKGLSLLDAYLRVNYKNMGQQAEQQAIQKLTTNQATSPGSLSGGDPSHKASISNMSKSDFQALQERVLRGEKVQL